MDSNQNSWSHVEDVDVTILAEPQMTFASVEINGETWSNIFGPGQHPTGVAINYTWLVENSADTSWEPSVSLQLENNMLGDCTSPGIISKNDVKPVTCTIIISAMAEPASEPEFKVTLNGDLVSVNQTVSMLVATSKEVSWKIDGTSVLTTGQESTVELTITNTGNTLVSGAIMTTPPSGWSVIIDGSDSVNLEAGQSQDVVLRIKSNQPGTGSIGVSISGDSDVIGSKYDLQLTSEGDIVEDDSSATSTLVWTGSAIFLVAIFAGLFIVLNKKKPAQVPVGAPASAFFQSNAHQSNATPCFSCRQPILSMMQGCPSCGARYHAVCNVPNCVNCGAESSTFVNVES